VITRAGQNMQSNQPKYGHKNARKDGKICNKICSIKSYINGFKAFLMDNEISLSIVYLVYLLFTYSLPQILQKTQTLDFKRPEGHIMQKMRHLIENIQTMLTWAEYASMQESP
jgi:hypothetical protein